MLRHHLTKYSALSWLCPKKLKCSQNRVFQRQLSQKLLQPRREASVNLSLPSLDVIREKEEDIENAIADDKDYINICIGQRRRRDFNQLENLSAIDDQVVIDTVTKRLDHHNDPSNRSQATTSVLSLLSASLQCFEKLTSAQQATDNEDRFCDEEEIVSDILSNSIFPTKDEIMANHEFMDFADLQACVLALSLWPPGMMLKPTGHHVPTESESVLRSLVGAFDTASRSRMFGFVPEKSQYFFMDPWRRLAIGKAWIHVLCGNFLATPPNQRKFHHLRSSTFPYVMIGKLADRSVTDQSKRFFSKLTPDTFMDLVTVLDAFKDLPDNFHKFYAIFKFFEYVEYLDIDDVCFTCRVFNRLQIKVSSYHPVAQCLSTSILNKMIANVDNVGGRHILAAVTYLDGQLLAPIHGELLSNLQDKCAQSSSMTLEDMINLLHLGHAWDGFEKSDKLTNVVLDNIASIGFPHAQWDSVTPFGVRKLLQLMLHPDYLPKTDSPALDSVYMKVRDTLSSNKYDLISKCSIGLHLAYLGIYDHKLLDLIMSDPRLGSLQQVDGRRCLHLGDHINYNPSSSDFLIRSALRMMMGVIQMKVPDYQGIMFAEVSWRRLIDWYDVPRPEHYNKKSSEYSSLWTILGLQVPKIVCEEFNVSTNSEENFDPGLYVIETTILPCFGLTDYVFCVSKADGSLKPLSNEFKEQDEREPKRILRRTTDDLWISLSFLNKRKMSMYKNATFNPQEPHVKLMEELGYVVYQKDIGQYKDPDEVAALENVRLLVRKIVEMHY